MCIELISHALVFPAYAGVIPEVTLDQNQANRVPRVCGGDPNYILRCVTVSKCSPRKRG